MKQYLLKLLGAWVLLRAASALLKDAERNLRTAAETKDDLAAASKPEVIDAEVVNP